MNILSERAWTTPSMHPEMSPGHVHVWRIQLADARNEAAHFATLSADERRRATRFYSRPHGRRYTIAHGMLRRILSGYARVGPASFEFEAAEHGKPLFAAKDDEFTRGLHFNLSHSADIALVAVSRTGPVGVDVEWWRPRIQHLAVAERFFSVREREGLVALDGEEAVIRGFFTAWSRKEAYLKATGHGISRGLHHFDVTLDPNLPAEILQDRLDASAPERWAMANIDAGVAYSAALVAARPVTDVKLFDAAETELPT